MTLTIICLTVPTKNLMTSSYFSSTFKPSWLISVLFRRKIRPLFHNRQLKSGKFQDFKKMWSSNRILLKFWSGTINTLYFSNQHVKIYVRPKFVCGFLDHFFKSSIFQLNRKLAKYIFLQNSTSRSYFRLHFLENLIFAESPIEIWCSGAFKALR